MLSPLPRRSGWDRYFAHSPQSYQPSPVWQPDRPAHRPFRGLLGVHSRYGLHTRAVTVCRDTLNRRLQPFRCLHSCSGCFRLEPIAGWDLHPLESAAFARRTPSGVTRGRLRLGKRPSPRCTPRRKSGKKPRRLHTKRRLASRERTGRDAAAEDNASTPLGYRVIAVGNPAALRLRVSWRAAPSPRRRSAA